MSSVDFDPRSSDQGDGGLRQRNLEVVAGFIRVIAEMIDGASTPDAEHIIEDAKAALKGACVLPGEVLDTTPPEWYDGSGFDPE